MKKLLKTLGTLLAVVLLTTSCNGNATKIEYGTSDDPLTINEFEANLNKLNSGTLSDKEMYVSGVISSVTKKETYGTYDIKLQSEQNVIIGSAILGEGIVDPAVGDTISAKGYGKFTSSDTTTYSMGYCVVNNQPYNPTIYKLEKGTGEDPGDPVDPVDPVTPVDPVIPTGMGTLENPLTISQFQTICSALEEGSFSTEKGYVEGTVSSVDGPSQFGSYNIFFNSEKTLEGYSVQLNNFTTPKAGDVVVLYGYFKHHTYKTSGSEELNHVYEVAYNSAQNDSPIIVKLNGQGSGTGQGTDPVVPVTPTTDYPEGNLNEPVKSGVAYTIFFDTKDSRTTYSEKNQQVWECNYYKVDNHVVGSETGPGDYANPARFYQGTEVVISSKCDKNIKCIVFVVDTTYKTEAGLTNGLLGGTYTAGTGTLGTYIVDNINKNSVSFVCSSQFRLAQISVVFA